MTIHPLTRDLYKRALVIGKDYPHPEGLDYVRRIWKAALRNPQNCPSWYDSNYSEKEREIELRRAVAKGRSMLKEMIGVIQFKKYRTMKSRYDTKDP